MATRRTAAEIIAYQLGGWNITDVQEYRYQPTRYASPAVYAIGNDYYAAPSSNAKPRYDFGLPWVLVGEFYGRKVYRSGPKNERT
jgi:hypothetical protein